MYEASRGLLYLSVVSCFFVYLSVWLLCKVSLLIHWCALRACADSRPLLHSLGCRLTAS
jgi:hypothetical protein